MTRGGKKVRCPFKSAEDCSERLNAYFGTFLGESGEIADVESLADYLGVTREDLLRLKGSKEYGTSLNIAFNRIAKIKKQLAFCGKLNATVLSFDLRNNHGYAEKGELSESDGATIVFKGKTAEWAK